jgi:hypothetical protein
MQIGWSAAGAFTCLITAPYFLLHHRSISVTVSVDGFGGVWQFIRIDWLLAVLNKCVDVVADIAKDVHVLFWNPLSEVLWE